MVSPGEARVDSTGSKPVGVALPHAPPRMATPPADRSCSGGLHANGVLVPYTVLEGDDGDDAELPPVARCTPVELLGARGIRGREPLGHLAARDIQNREPL